MKFVLLMLIISSGSSARGAATLSAEFDNKQACVAAAYNFLQTKGLRDGRIDAGKVRDGRLTFWSCHPKS